MIDLDTTDIRLDASLALTCAADGDAPLCTDPEALCQCILLEALTQKGDLFYDADFGWSLYDFLGSEDDALTRLEISQRARAGLAKVAELDPDSIVVELTREGDAFLLACRFRFFEEEALRALNLLIGSLDVEVVALD